MPDRDLKRPRSERNVQLKKFISKAEISVLQLCLRRPITYKKVSATMILLCLNPRDVIR